MSPRPPPKRRYPIEPLTAGEVKLLMRQFSTTTATGIRNRALITVMYRSGLRISEALALKPADVDPKQGSIRVLHGKGDKSRVVSIDDDALAVVQRWMDRRKIARIRNGYLFCTLQGADIKGSYVRAMLKRQAERAGITKRIHPHGLRHSHAAELVAEGVPVNVIQQQLGHAHLSTTDVYLRHVAPADVIAIGRNRTWNLEDEA